MYEFPTTHLGATPPTKPRACRDTGNPPLWGQSTMGYSPHKQRSNISILHIKKWKSWAVILWLDLLVQSYLINIQLLWFTSNPRKPSQWSLGNLDSREQTPLSNISITYSWSNASCFVLQYPPKWFRIPAVPSPDPLDATAFCLLDCPPCGNQTALEP